MAFFMSSVFHLYFAEFITIHFKYFLRSVWFFLHFIESFTQTLTRPHFVLLQFILFFSLFTTESCSLSPRLSVFIYLFRGGRILCLCLNPGFTFDNVFNLFVPRFLHLYSRNNSSTYLTELLWELNVLTYKIHIWYCLVQSK